MYVYLIITENSQTILFKLKIRLFVVGIEYLKYLCPEPFLNKFIHELFSYCIRIFIYIYNLPTY